jgi:tRNA threonylcarbamoyladenosine biosynthesis protein TsaB
LRRLESPPSITFSFRHVPLHSPTLLALDTAADLCSVALLRGGALAELSETVGNRHSERALPMVQQLLANAGIGLDAVDGFAFGAGPGAFTGLRIACGLAQGLAFGTARKLLAVGNLEALAHAATAPGEVLGQTVLCVNDARMREAYCAVYRRRIDGLDELAAPATVPAGELSAWVDRLRPDLIVGDAVELFAQPLCAAALQVPARFMRIGAAAILSCAARRWPAGAIDPAAAAPMYVRDHVALTIEERRQRAEALA